jgi:hypothetical protein
MPDSALLHPVRRAHLRALTDGVGIHQHAIGSLPDPAHGYCTDDVARALLVDLLHGRALGWTAVAASARRGMRFLDAAFDEATGRFRNFRRSDGSWVDGPGSEDCHGRAMWALGETIATAQDAALAEVATSLFVRALPGAADLAAPRARASALLGCDAVLRVVSLASVARVHRRLAERLHASFRPGDAAGWPWPEPRLTYENALPPHALVVAGTRLGSAAMVHDGLELIDWLIAVQTAPGGHLSPVGNGWWARDGERSRFDQQPIEATSLLLAADAAFRATDHGRYRSAMERCYAWFLGANDVGAPVADPVRGAGRDGITPTGVNTNEGAESTLMWLIALEQVRILRGELSSHDRSPLGRPMLPAAAAGDGAAAATA